MYRRTVLLIAVVAAAVGPGAAAERATVAVIASDMPHLQTPTSREHIPGDAAIEEMVAEAMELGGIRRVLRPDAQHVLLKPCIVTALRDPGRNTDPRAVRVVALLVHRIAPHARITVADGPGAWMKEARAEVKHWELVIADGFETEGYYAALRDRRLADAQIEFVDLNFADPRRVRVPGGGMARDEYWIAGPVLDADVTITLPRLKLAAVELGGITVALKNQVGVAPGIKYGWPKKTGYPSGSGNSGIPHTNEILGETITDLNLCAGIDFAVAESFRRPIDRPGEEWSGWINAVVAGADLVAVDAVSAYLMGFNPEEVETVVNGERRGLGVGRLEAIDLEGERDLDRIRRGFPSRWASRMGMANRTWVISGPHPRTASGLAAVDPAGPCAPGVQGFGQPVWFQDDKCDLGQVLDRPTDCVAFAYCEFDAPRAEAAQLQVASDEGMTVWLNGAQVYRFDGWRRVERPNEMVPVSVNAGRNALLCRLEQSTRQFVFSVNVATAAQDPLTGRIARIPGLRFRAPGETAQREILAPDTGEGDSWRQPGWWRESSVDQTRPDSLALEGVVPEGLQARGLGVLRARYFGDTVRLRGQVQGEEVVLCAANAAEAWVDLGLLRGVGQPARVRVVELDLAGGGRRGPPLETPRDSAVVWSGTVPPSSVLVLRRPDVAVPWNTAWVAAAPPPADAVDAVVGELSGPLSAEVSTLELVQSSGGLLLAEAYRQGAGADIGIAIASEVRAGLPAGAVRRGSLLDLTRPDGARLASWSMTGAQVRVLLEGLLDLAANESYASPQLAGLSATVDLSRPRGERVLQISLAPQRTVRVATLSRYAGWFWAVYTGKEVGGRGPWWRRVDAGGDQWPQRREHGLTPVQAVEVLLAQQRPYAPAGRPPLEVTRARQAEAR
ncbi:MAG: DUF362 domain-containing protein [Candidatus Latescibacterota bacterium]